MIKRLIIFLVLNFLGLALGSYFTQAVASSWYQGLVRAPWEPPGWVFGVAWTTIMILFSAYLARAKNHLDEKDLKVFYLTFAGSWLLNVIWNPIFFALQHTELGLIVIMSLGLFVFRFLQEGYRNMKWEWILIVPYMIWILIATSLNLYIILYN